MKQVLREGRKEVCGNRMGNSLRQKGVTQGRLHVPKFRALKEDFLPGALHCDPQPCWTSCEWGGWHIPTKQLDQPLSFPATGQTPRWPFL